MCTIKRMLRAIQIAIVPLLLFAGAWNLQDAAEPARAQANAADIYQQYVDAFNRGDVDGAVESFADDAVVGGMPGCLPVDCVGKDAIRNMVEFYVADHIRITITSSEVSGNTATGSVEIEEDVLRAGGIERFLGLTSVEVANGKIREYRLTADVSDGQTATAVAYIGASSVSVELGPGRDADQSPGTAVLLGVIGDGTAVYVTIPPGPAGVRQPTRIHQGTCGSLGPAAFSLQDIGGGKSLNVIDASIGNLQTGNFAIAVQQSQDEPDVYVACGDIPAAAAEVPPAEPAPAKEEAPAAEGGAKVLVAGSPIHGANGLMFDAKGRLYIASVVGREIVVMDPETGEILDRLGPDRGVESPDDLTFGPDGSLYWTALLTGEVGRLSPDGVKTSQKVALGVNPITFSDDGRLFVALDFLGDALYEVDPELVEPPRLIAENLGFLNGMDWGPDGFLYGPIWTKGEVVRIDVDTGAVTVVADGFGVPAAVKFDSQGRLYVGDQMRGEISRVDTETGSKEVIATNLPGLDNIAFDSHDRLFAANAQDGSISEALSNGTTRTVSPGGMIAPMGVAVLAGAGGESVFLADLYTLRQFDGLTGEEKSLERGYIAVSRLTTPMTVSADGNHLILSSWFGSAVQVWNPDTREVVEDLDFAFPLNAIRFKGDLVVAGLTSLVRASAADPEVRETLAEGLDTPAGLAATDDDLWVSEWGTGRVLQIVADGEALSEPVLVATGLSSPEGLALTPGGSLLVVEAGAGRLSRIDLATGEVSAIAEGLQLGAEGIPGFPGTWGFNGVAVGPSGTIYVTGDIGNVLYRIEAVEEPPVVAPPRSLPAAGSGGLLTEQGSGAATWWYALAAGGGALLVLVGLAALGITRSRR
jgi:sugar lactone lactonase YvrE